MYAEDADDGFVPATGRVRVLTWPSLADGLVRVDAGIEPGTEVDARFDPMLAKVVAAGPTRVEALVRLAQALDGTTVLGLTTNLRFLRWLIRQPVVLAGDARIDTLERIWPPDDRATTIAPPPEAWSLAARLLDPARAIDRLTDDRGRADPGPDPWVGGWRLNARPSLRLQADDGTERAVELADDSAVAHLAAVPASDGSVHVDVAGRSVAFRLAAAPDVDRAARAASHHGPTSGEVISPMPGAVTAVHVSVGSSVDVGDPVVTLEAMKMEHVVVAPTAGTVLEVSVRVTDQVRRGQILVLTG